MKQSKTVVLLDSHAILHRAYHAMGGFATRDGKPTGALYGFIMMVLRIYDEIKPDYIAACFDLPKPTFRHVSYDGYKAGRQKTDDALITQINEAYHLCEVLGIPVYKEEGFERR
jgi:DNA polymerase-1